MGRKAVSVEINSTNYVPFIVTPEAPFNVAGIEKMEITWSKDKDDKKRCALQILFVNSEGTRHHAHYENEIDGDLGTLTEEKRISAQDAHFAHLYDTFMSDGAYRTAGPQGTPLGTVFTKPKPGVDGAEPVAATVIAEPDYHKFFESVLNSFMTGNDGKPVFQNKDGGIIPVWLKLTYDKDGRLQVPLFNNFVNLYVKGKECLLNIDPRFDVVTKPTSVQNRNATASNTANTNPAAQKKPANFDF